MKFKTTWEKAVRHIKRCGRGRIIKGHGMVVVSKMTYNGKTKPSDVEIIFYKS